MREIKFRIWDRQEKEMFFEGFHVFGEVTMFNAIHQHAYETKGERSSLDRYNDFEITQFTGLEDKNGKDIYDGDICKVQSKHGFHSDLLNEFKEKNGLETINGIGLHFTGIIKLDFLRGVMFENPKNGYQEPLCTRMMGITCYYSEVEVIGNIYEHPHLISSKEQ